MNGPNCMALSILVLAACSATGADQPTDDVAGPPALEAAVIAALGSTDDAVVTSALVLFQDVGTEAHVDAVAAVLERPDAALRSDALHALGGIADNDPAARPAVLPHFVNALRAGGRECQLAALQALPASELEPRAEVEALLSHADWELRFCAASTLAWHGHRLHPNDVTGVLRDIAGSFHEWQAAVLLDQIATPEQRAALAPFLDSSSERLRMHAAEAVQRLDAFANGAAADWRPASQIARERYRAQNQAAEAALRARPWTRVPPSEVLAAARAARLVLFAEIHEDKGPLRAAQRTVLRAMAHEPGSLVVGYEPSAETAQRSVLDLARELGVRTLALETGWQPLIAAKRHAERDDQVAAAVAACLAERPDRRLLVLRGESHCLPDGYLCRQLPVPPVVILTARFPPLHQIPDPRSLVGSTYRIGDDQRTFYWGTMPLVQDALATFCSSFVATRRTTTDRQRP